MRTGRRMIFLLLFLCCCSAFPGFAGDCAEMLAKIRKSMGAVSTLQADFIQKKRISSMKHTLTIKGELALDRHGRMAWRVSSPIQYVCLIDGSTLTQWDADSDTVLKLDTSKNPALQVLAKSMGNYFSGRFDEMANEFSITAKGKDTLFLVPRKSSMISRFIESIEFRTSPDYSFITRVAIREVNGDEAVIEYSNVRKNQPVPESTWRAGAK